MPARLRIVNDNLAKAATVTASSQASALMVPANLKKPNYASVWRGLTKTETLTLTWPSPVAINSLALVHCNVSETGTIRVRGSLSSSQVLDTGTVKACAAPGVVPAGMTPAIAASAYAFGGGNTARVWFNRVVVTSLTVDITDAANLQGYVEGSVLWVGEYWSPARNPSWGQSLTLVDRSKSTVTEGGTLKTEKKTRSKKVGMNLNNMEELDRSYFTDMLLKNGTSEPMFVCLFPESDNPKMEQHYTILAKVSNLSAMTMPYWNAASSPLELEQC